MCAFYDPEESEFYGRCAEDFLLQGDNVNIQCGCRLVELGVGSGKALCGVLRRTNYCGVIDGYELDADSCRTAIDTIRKYGLMLSYRVTNADFFEATAKLPRPVYAIANPPYLPSYWQSASYPILSGGADGNAVINRMIRSRFSAMMVMLSSFSDPLNTIELAAAHGYSLVRWAAKSLEMGHYSNRTAVRSRINNMAADGRAFIRDDSYLLVGVTWCHGTGLLPDISNNLISALRAFPSNDWSPQELSSPYFGASRLICDVRDEPSS